MKVFLDTNIFMEYVSRRKQYEVVRDIFDAIEDKRISAVISVGGLYTTAYLLTRMLKDMNIHRPEQTERLRMGLNGLMRLATVTDCNHEHMAEAVNDERFIDIEDSFQYHCAMHSQCDVLITINLKDYKNVITAGMPVLTPDEFVARYL